MFVCDRTVEFRVVRCNMLTFCKGQIVNVFMSFNNVLYCLFSMKTTYCGNWLFYVVCTVTVTVQLQKSLSVCHSPPCHLVQVIALIIRTNVNMNQKCYFLLLAKGVENCSVVRQIKMWNLLDPLDQERRSREVLKSFIFDGIGTD